MSRASRLNGRVGQSDVAATFARVATSSAAPQTLGPTRFFGPINDGALTDLQPAGAPLVQAPLAASPLAIPTYDGSGKIVEPCVVYCPEGWNGYQFWMAAMPYPAANANYENPCLYVSVDGQTWTAAPGVTNPLVPQPSSGGLQNADNSLFLDRDGTMYLYYITQNIATPTGFVSVISSKDGVTWTAPQQIIGPNATAANYNTPCVVWDGQQYRLYVVDCNSTYTAFRIKFFTGSTPVGPWSASPTTCDVTSANLPGGGGPSHLNLQRYGGKFYAVVADSNLKLHFVSSWDGIAWSVPTTALAVGAGSGWDTLLYRAAFAIQKTGRGHSLALWYGGKDASNNYQIGYTTAALNTGGFWSGPGVQQVDSSFQVVDNKANNLLRSVAANSWSDNATAQFLQVGNASGRAVFQASTGQPWSRLMLNASQVTIGGASHGTLPVPAASSLMEWVQGTTVVQAITSTGGHRLGSTAGLGAAHYSGSGTPTIAGALGDLYFRSDTPGTANQRIYACTTAGAAGAAVWAAIL